MLDLDQNILLLKRIWEWSKTLSQGAWFWVKDLQRLRLWIDQNFMIGFENHTTALTLCQIIAEVNYIPDGGFWNRDVFFGGTQIYTSCSFLYYFVDIIF